MNDLKTLERAIKRLKDKMEIDHEYMDADDLGDLTVTICGLESMKQRIEHNNYVDQLEQFVDYLENALSDDDERNEWMSTPYVITQGKQSVTLCNCADVYDGLLTVLREHIKDIS